MNTVLLSYSGNAGKTTTARNLIAPRTPGARLVSVESINADGQEDLTLRGRQFSELLDALALSEGLIVDVGASNVEDFLQRMSQTRRSHQLFDRFIVPTMPGTKQARDCIATVEALAHIGVPAAKVFVLCNGLEATITLADAFAPVVKYLADTRRAQLVPTAISDSEVYGRLAATGHTLDDVLADGIDHMAAMRSATTPEARLTASQAFSLVGLAESAAEELDMVWAALHAQAEACETHSA